MDIRVIDKKRMTEREMMEYIKHNPKGMRNRWRGRIGKSIDELSKETDPKEREWKERSIYLQKKKLKEWDSKVDKV